MCICLRMLSQYPCTEYIADSPPFCDISVIYRLMLSWQPYKQWAYVTLDTATAASHNEKNYNIMQVEMLVEVFRCPWATAMFVGPRTQCLASMMLLDNYLQLV